MYVHTTAFYYITRFMHACTHTHTYINYINEITYVYAVLQGAHAVQLCHTCKCTLLATLSGFQKLRYLINFKLNMHSNVQLCWQLQCSKYTCAHNFIFLFWIYKYMMLYQADIQRAISQDHNTPTLM